MRLAALLVLLPTSAFAVCEGNAEYADIPDRVGCMRVELAAAEGELDALWAEVLASYGGAGTAATDRLGKLAASDAAWRGWVEAECRANSEVPRIGTYWELARLECVHMLTVQRIAYLTELYAP